MPIGTQTNSDDFNRADETPLSGGGNWIVSTNQIKLISNHIQPNATTNDRWALYTAWSNGNDHYSQLEVTAVSGTTGNGLGVFVRHDPSAAVRTGYRVVINGGGGYELGRESGGSFTSLLTGSVSYVAGAPLGLAVFGDGSVTPVTLQVWYNGVQIGSDFQDTSASKIITGVPGILYSSSLSSVPTGDNWTAGTTGGGGAPPPTNGFFQIF